MRNKLKAYNFLLVAILLVSALGLIAIVNYLDPYGSWLHLVLFYADLLTLIVSLAGFLGFQVRQVFGQREQSGHYLTISLRQASWFAVLIVGSLILQSFDFFNLINAIILVLAFVFLESYFLYNAN